LAYYKAFIELLDAVKDVCVHFRVPAKFTFDISTENEYNARLLYKGTREDSPDMIGKRPNFPSGVELILRMRCLHDPSNGC
jgi:hypothetical protein